MSFLCKIYTSVIVNLLINISAYTQCVAKVTSFSPGETLTYQAYYNWGFIWVHAGDVKFSVSEKQLGKKQTTVLEATGNSLKSYDWMYKVRDRFHSVVDAESFNPLIFEQNTLESGYAVNQTFTFSYISKKIYTDIETSKKPRTKDTITLSNCVFDVLSGIYYCRTLNFDNYKKFDKIPLNMIIDGKIYPLFVRYLGKETIRLHEGKQQYKCFKFSVMLVEGTIFKGGEDMNVWVTDDANKVPVLVESKILVGSVKAYLNTAQGLRNPSTAQIIAK